MGFSQADLTQDKFLGGMLTIRQPRQGYRAGSDAVFLAASVAARPGQQVLELGCGVGVATLCLARRVADLALTGVEIQPDYADLARRNASENGVQTEVVTADLCNLPEQVRDQRFDHVFANPPYYQSVHRKAAADGGREQALAGDTPLHNWLDIAARRLKPGGYLTMIQKPDRLPDILAAIDARLGSIRVKPLAARHGRACDTVIVVAQKAGRARFRLLAPFILHEGAQHVRDGESYTAAAQAILRQNGALEIG